MEERAVSETATLLAAVFPSAVSHASALLAHTIGAEPIHVALENMAWIKRLIVEACLRALD
ncbi:hypothetical protein [Actinoplanes sp. NPDC051411]|jgi:hypothetical protein|uniref:hypothetical protein n=1 Tax=Actinoplanes sp. NPDC051411 TaxID=3155522 RepID=UPI00343BC3B6